MTVDTVDQRRRIRSAEPPRAPVHRAITAPTVPRKRTATITHDPRMVTSMPSNRRSRTVVILTALNVEYQPLRAHLTVPVMHRHQSGTLFEVGRINGTTARVALAVASEGIPAAAVLAEQAITTFNPHAVLFTGIAGSLQACVGLGDVVVATKLYAYHCGKENDDTFTPRPRTFEAPHDLIQLARHIDRTRAWTSLLPPQTEDANPGVHFKPIATGDVVLNSRTSPLARHVNDLYSDAYAIETEGAGVCQAGHFSRVPVLNIRAISDRADGSKADTDASGWQPLAAANAAAFALTLAAHLGVDEYRVKDLRGCRSEVNASPWSSDDPVRQLAAAYGADVSRDQHPTPAARRYWPT